jgi:very-short-patch-repair endonuclease
MSIKQKLELVRQELLDMGIRGNPMLHVPRNSRFLEIMEGDASFVYSVLTQERKSFGFRAIGEEEVEDGAENIDADFLPEDENPDEEDAGYSSAAWDALNSRQLPTRLADGTLDARLLKMESEAHTLLQEQGIDVLYVALGFLEWYEDTNAQTPRYAPLVLVPVELSRESARSRFQLSYTGADLGPNLNLGAKLKGEFRLELPDFDEEFDFTAYLEVVGDLVADQARWRVHPDRMVLGFFSFGKFQMYVDLDPGNWPDQSALLENSQLRKLFENGFQSDADLLEDVSGHDALREPETLHLVKDADSSQMEAILAVMEGANLVIQGPPGTGKSQTITNLVGEALARGKTVLFVAQKMAALEVVKSRLDECHLGDAVLELHSHKSNKKAVLDSLKHVFEQGKPSSPDRDAEYRRLKEVREYLDSYVEDVSAGVLDSGLNYVQCLGRMLQLRKDARLDELSPIPFDRLRQWDREALGRGERAMAGARDHLREFGPAEDNPFNRSRRDTLSPNEDQVLTRLVADSSTRLDTLMEDSRGLAQAMKVPEPVSFADISVLHRAGKRALDAPHLQGVRVSTHEWQVRRDDIREAVSSGAEMARLRASLSEVFIDAAFEADLLPVRMGLAGRADKWWRVFSGAYRTAKTDLRGLMKGQLTGKPIQWLGWVDDLLAYQKHYKRFRELEPVCRSLFGAQWQGMRSDWPVLERLSTWIIELYEAIGKGDLPEGLADFLEGDPDLKSSEGQVESLEKQSSQLQSMLGDLQVLLRWEAEDGADYSLADWRDLLDGWRDTSRLYAMTRFIRLEKEIEAAGLGSLIPQLRDWRRSPEVLVDWLRLSYFLGLVDTAYGEKTRIGQFDRLAHERMIHEFAQLDQSAFSFAQEKLVSHLHGTLPSIHAPGEMDILRREFSKKRRHLPIRRLISEAGGVIQRIKPVFMMSPMSVATYLPQGKIRFDLVIFDEASQIPAPEALGAIIRGSQAVVVGDSKQMPPTNFFSRAVEISDEEAELSATADVESILGLMLAQGVPERMLRWHYRSRHHSLIAVSNDQFYQNQLLIFPSPGSNPHARGLRFHHLAHTHYDRGGARANVGEAQAVAQAVMVHARETPELSLGVVAFSTAQREVILLEVERLRRKHPETEAFFRHHDGGDEFFIKNLENVQGDERDVIFISIGYGFTAMGQLGQNFGPLNGKGGERRLNVLITRSRLAMDVFANFRADDLRVDANSPFGVRALKAFLHYAETGDLPKGQESEREPDSPFELEVKQAIERLGYEVEPQVGSEGFYIDLAVRDPNKPGRYVLAVECDGASYHSSAIARERDRLRQAVLEGLGWTFHRIWSTEWFRNARGELERLKAAIESAVRHQVSMDRPDDDEKPSVIAKPATLAGPQIVREENGDEDVRTGIPSYVPVDESSLGLPGKVNDFLTISEVRLAAATLKVVSGEGPVHVQVLTSRLMSAVGLSRAGSRVQQRVMQIIGALERKGHVSFDGEFVSTRDNLMSPPLRDWSVLPQAVRKFEYVPDVELAHAVYVTVKDAHSIHPEDCMSAALNLIGFRRLTTSIRERLESVIDGLISTRILKLLSDRLQPGDSEF